MDEVKYVSSELLNIIGIKHGWFMRYGGVSEGLFESLNGKKGSGDIDENVDENRRRAIQAVIPAQAGIQTAGAAHIIHEFKTNILRAEVPGEYKFYDASLTSKRDVVLSQTTADCASIVIADTNQRVVSLIHGSWHTLNDNIIRDTVAKLKTIPGVGELVAGIGPMICRGCYEFGPEAKELFESKYIEPIACHPKLDLGSSKTMDPLVKPEDDSVGKAEKYLVDLKQMAINQLSESGITKIDDLNICTKEDKRFFSHRRDGASSGRMITLTSLTDVIS